MLTGFTISETAPCLLCPHPARVFRRASSGLLAMCHACDLAVQKAVRARLHNRLRVRRWRARRRGGPAPTLETAVVRLVRHGRGVLPDWVEKLPPTPEPREARPPPEEPTPTGRVRRVCRTEDCGAPLNAGRYQSTHEYCRPCRARQREKARALVEFGTPEEIATQLADTSPIEGDDYSEAWARGEVETEPP